ncbi:MAG: efflux RND transporter permease subunit [bacterium]|nr:efflux RND transporter permease subunit [bacterium]
MDSLPSSESSPATGGRSTGRLTAGIIEYYRVSILAVAGLVIGGLWAFFSLPRTEDPEFDPHDLKVVTLWPGVAAGEVEELLTRPVEEAIDELDDIERVWSRSASGLSMVVVRIAADGVPATVADTIEKRLEDARSELPAGILGPEVHTLNPADIPVVLVSLQGPRNDRQLLAWAERLERELEAIETVSRVVIEGTAERQIQVLADDQRLAQYRIPLQRLRDVLRLENAGVPGGELDVGRQRYPLENPGELESLQEIEEVVLGSVGDSVVRVRDVARVEDAFADPFYVVRTNRRPALLLAVGKKPNTNTVAVAAAVRRRLDRLRPSLPAGFELTVINDRGASVGALLGNLGANALGGAVIVMLMVTLFLGLRQAVVVSITIPLSVLIALLLMRVTGIDLHQVSIFGLVLALGMLVDSALVMVESIARQLEREKGLFGAVVSGVDEVRTPVISSVVTTVAAFLPLLFLGGVVGDFVYSLPMSLIFALAGSLLAALTLVPLLCYALWRNLPPAGVRQPEHRPRILEWYRESAKWALRHRGLTLGLALALFALAVSSIPGLGIQFFPKAEKGFFLINVRLDEGANLEATDAITAQVEEMLAAEAAVRDTTANIGKGSPRIYYNELREHETPSYAQVLVHLREDFGGSVESYVEELSSRLGRISGAAVEPRVLQQGPFTGAAIEVRLRGDDLETLAALAARIRQRIESVPGVTDVRDSLGSKSPRLALELDRRKAALLGVDSFTFASTVRIAVAGETATLFRDGDEEVPVVVRLDPAGLQEISHLERLYLPSRFDRMVPFAELATVEETADFARISRREGRRMVSVECGVSGRLTADAAAEIRQRLSDLALPAGYDLEIGGESEIREESFAGLGRAMMLALLGIYVVLAIQFNSFTQPFVILFTVPFGIVGAVAGLWLTGHPFGFMAFVGIVSLTGILINDSIVLTDFANHLQRHEGQRKYAALLDAGERRFRPVILTSITTIAGMTPLAIWGGGLWSPLAVALIFGLAGATVLILILLPVIYSLMVHPAEQHRGQALWSRWRRRLIGRERVSRSSGG